MTLFENVIEINANENQLNFGIYPSYFLLFVVCSRILLLVFEVKRQTFGLPKYQFRKRSLRHGRRFKKCDGGW